MKFYRRYYAKKEVPFESDLLFVIVVIWITNKSGFFEVSFFSSFSIRNPTGFCELFKAEKGRKLSFSALYYLYLKLLRGVRAITNLKGYKPIEILNPSVLLESGGEYEEEGESKT